MTAPTQEEAEAIRRWAEALWVAEKAVSDAHASLHPVRDSNLREIRLADIRCFKLLCEVTEFRVEAERAAEKIS